MSRPKYPSADLGATLRKHREAAGLSRREVALRIHVDPTTVTHWESGRRTPVLADLDAYLRAVGASMMLGVAA